MSEPVTLPPPIIDLTPPPGDKWEREVRAFHALLPQLLQTHRGQYVAIHEGQVVDSGEDKLAVAMRAYDRIGYVLIFVSLVAERPLPAERIPHYRVVE